MIVTLIRKSKQNYFNKYFSDNIKNLRQTWKGIFNILQLKNKTDSSPTCIINKGTPVTDPTQIANIFNCYFSTIGKTLQSKIYSNYISYTKY